MEITFKGRHTSVPERFRRHASDKLAKLEKLDHNAIRIDIEVSTERNPRQADRSERVELTVRSRGPAIRAEAAADDRYAALDLACTKLEGRLRKAAERRKVRRGDLTVRSTDSLAAVGRPGRRGRRGGGGGRPGRCGHPGDPRTGRRGHARRNAGRPQGGRQVGEQAGRQARAEARQPASGPRRPEATVPLPALPEDEVPPVRPPADEAEETASGVAADADDRRRAAGRQGEVPRLAPDDDRPGAAGDGAGRARLLRLP